MSRKYLRKADYIKIRKYIEEMVEENVCLLVEDVLAELLVLGYEVTVHHLAHIVRYSDTVVKLYERKKCAGAPTGHFVWLVQADAWAQFSKSPYQRRMEKCE
jgi:hypothetical protein